MLCTVVVCAKHIAPRAEELQGSAQQKANQEAEHPEKEEREKIRREKRQLLPQAPEAIVRSKPPFPFIAASTLVATPLFAVSSSGFVN